MEKNNGIMVFKDTFEYLVDGELSEHQFCELMKLIYEVRFGDVDIDDVDIEDKELRLVWKTLKHSIKKSKTNSKHYSKRTETPEASCYTNNKTENRQ